MPWVEKPNRAAGSGARTRVEPMERTRRGAGRAGVDEISPILAFQPREERCGLPVRLLDPDAVRKTPPKQPPDQPAGRIVAAIRIADSNHDGGHARLISSLRKCVLQEMQGS